MKKIEMKKSVIALALLVSMFSTVLAGCGGYNKEETTKPSVDGAF